MFPGIKNTRLFPSRWLQGMHNPLCNNNSTANTPGRNFSISRGPALTTEPWGDRYELGLWFLSCATSIKHWSSPCLRCPFCGYATQGWRWLVCLQSRQISTNLLCWACWKRFPSCTRWFGFLCLRSMVQAAVRVLGLRQHSLFRRTAISPPNESTASLDDLLGFSEFQICFSFKTLAEFCFNFCLNSWKLNVDYFWGAFQNIKLCCISGFATYSW